MKVPFVVRCLLAFGSTAFGVAVAAAYVGWYGAMVTALIVGAGALVVGVLADWE